MDFLPLIYSFMQHPGGPFDNDIVCDNNAMLAFPQKNLPLHHWGGGGEGAKKSPHIEKNAPPYGKKVAKFHHI